MDVLPEKLFVIFQNVNEWLKFAEAKNAVLLAFAGTGMTVTVTLLATMQSLPNSLKMALIVTTSLLCACSFLCGLSFLPTTNLERVLWLRSKKFQANTPMPSDNLYYFGHLRKYSSNQLLDSINQNYLSNKVSQPYGKESQDLAAQITVNAEIAFRKYQLFTYATYCLVTSIIIIPMSILFSLIFFRGL